MRQIDSHNELKGNAIVLFVTLCSFSMMKLPRKSFWLNGHETYLKTTSVISTLTHSFHFDGSILCIFGEVEKKLIFFYTQSNKTVLLFKKFLH